MISGISSAMKPAKGIVPFTGSVMSGEKAAGVGKEDMHAGLSAAAKIDGKTLSNVGKVVSLIPHPAAQVIGRGLTVAGEVKNVADKTGATKAIEGVGHKVIDGNTSPHNLVSADDVKSYKAMFAAREAKATMGAGMKGPGLSMPGLTPPKLG